MPDKIITTDRALRAIQRKLESAELAHLRSYIEQQQAKIEDLQERLQVADDNAEYWRESWFEIAESIAAETGSAIGLTVDGQVGVVDRNEAA